MGDMKYISVALFIVVTITLLLWEFRYPMWYIGLSFFFNSLVVMLALYAFGNLSYEDFSRKLAKTKSQKLFKNIAVIWMIIFLTLLNITKPS